MEVISIIDCLSARWLAVFRSAPVFAFLLAVASPSAEANTPPYIIPLNDKVINVGDSISERVIPDDADGDVPGLRLINAPSGADFIDNGDGTRTLHWTPVAADIGVHELTFEAFDALDSSLTHTQQLRVDVVDASSETTNLAPTIEPLSDQRIALGSSFDFRVTPVDPEGIVPSLHVTLLPEGASFSDNRNGTRQLSWTPSEFGPGTVHLTFTAVDAENPSLSSSETITLQVTDSTGTLLPGTLGDSLSADNPDDNSPPVFNPIESQSVALGQAFDFNVNPTDADGTVPGLDIVALPPGATFTDNFDGSRRFRWSPLPVNIGDTMVTFRAIDATYPSIVVQKSIQLNVFRDPDNPVNFEPYINGIRNPLIRAGDVLNQIVQPVDPDFVVPSLQVLDAPSGSEFVDNGDGSRTLIWPTDNSDIGDTSVSFMVIDADDPSAQASSTVTISVVDPSTLTRSGERLRTLAAQQDINLGFAAVLNSSTLADNQLYLEMAAEEFDIITPENSHKMGWIHPQRGTFRFDDADSLADYADANDMLLHGHPLIWYAQLPGWVQSLDPADAQEVMLEHIEAVAGRYRSRVAVWDVVNEALEDDGQLRQSIWFKGMGKSYISKAFEATRAIDPDAQLIYNDYDVIWENPKSDAMYTLLKQELEAGTPIDGVGFQTHLRSDFSDFDSVERNLQRFADLGLDIYITEFDVALDAPDDEQAQADIYQQSLEICLAQPRCKAMQAWGFTDRYSWRSEYTPLLFDDRYQAKPAYYSWQRVLSEFDR